MPHLRDYGYETPDDAFVGGVGQRACAGHERDDDVAARSARADSHDEADAVSHRHAPGCDPSSTRE
jgi:hypothetical protein